MKKISKRKTEKMSDKAFKMMILTFKIIDFIFPYVKNRIKNFNLQQGMTVIDYGCGPGRYTIPFSKIVGQNGEIYAVDIHQMALEQVKQKIKKLNITNIKTILASGNDDNRYDTGLPERIGDVVCAFDMFFIIKKPTEFLAEISRILKDDGILIIDDGHQSRKTTKEKINNSDLFEIIEESRDHLKLQRK